MRVLSGWFGECRLEEGRPLTTRKPSAGSTRADAAALLVVRESEALSSSRKALRAFRTTPLRCLLRPCFVQRASPFQSSRHGTAVLPFPIHASGASVGSKDEVCRVFRWVAR